MADGCECYPVAEQTGYRVLEVRAEGDDALPRGILTTEQPVAMFDWARGEYIPEVLLADGMKSRGTSIKLLDTHRTDSVRDVIGSFDDIQTHDAGERDVPYRFADGAIRISSTEADIATKVREGHINEMSVGYRYSDEKTEFVPAGETREIGGQEFAGPVNVRTEWAAQEASLVPLGADDQAQIRGFRSIDDARQKISRQLEANPSAGGSLTAARGAGDDKPAAEERSEQNEGTQTKNQHQQQRKSVMETANSSAIADAEDLENARADAAKVGKEDFEKRADAIMAVGEEVGDAQWALSQLREGKSVEDVQRAAIAKLKEQTAEVGYRTEGELGLTKKEKQRYSISRALSQLALKKPVDGLEGEASKAVADRCGRDTDGFFVAPDVMCGGTRSANSGQRDLTVVSPGTADELVDTEHRYQDFIELLQPNMVTAQAGVRMITGLVGNVDFPRKTGRSTSAWPGDEVATAYSESTPTFDSVSLSPQPLGTYIEASKTTLTQALPDADRLIRDDLNESIAIALDQAVLRGSGSGQPQGIDGATGVAITSISVAGQPDKGELFTFLEDLDTANALRTNSSWVTTPAVASYLKQTLLDSGVHGYMWNMADNSILGHPAYSTAQADTADIFFGDFSEYIMGLWDGVEITLNPYIKDITRLVRFMVHVLADGDVRQPSAFVTNA